MKLLLITAAVLSLSTNLTSRKKPLTRRQTRLQRPRGTASRMHHRLVLANQAATGTETNGECVPWRTVRRRVSEVRGSGSRTAEPRSTYVVLTVNRRRIAPIFSCRCLTGCREELPRRIAARATTTGIAHVFAEAG